MISAEVEAQKKALRKEEEESARQEQEKWAQRQETNKKFMSNIQSTNFDDDVIDF